MHSQFRKFTALAILASATVLAQAQPLYAPTRGQMLYATHCISCHTAQIHWREEKKAHDWDSLKVQVRRWQGNAGLLWDEADIVEVTRHLNDAIYHYPQTADRVSAASQRPVR